MIGNIVQILTQAGQSLSEQIKNNTVKVTGKSAKSVGYEVSVEKTTANLKITAKPFIRVVETGRKPTPDKKPSRKMIENISEWLNALGKEQSLAWAIATNINKKGTKLWQQGGREDVFSNVLSERNINKIERTVLDEFAKAYLDEFLKELKANKLTN
jgi:hypothetical protein